MIATSKIYVSKILLCKQITVVIIKKKKKKQITVVIIEGESLEKVI